MPITKELLVEQINRLHPNDLEVFYELVKRFNQSRQHVQKNSLMSRLSQIQIEGPEDFAKNIDRYLSGEKV